MKRFITILLFAIVLVNIPLSFHHPAVIAQDEECNSDVAKQWLVDRQSYINATEDVLNAQGMGIPDAQMHLYNHLQAIEDLERPACADDVMMATYYFYNQIQHLFVCAAQSMGDCVTDMQARIKTYRDTIGTTISPVASIAGFSSVEYTSARPEGWSLAQVTQEATPQTSTSLPGVVSSATGTRSDSIPLGQYYQFDKGKVRIVAITDPYNLQGWSPSSTGLHAIAFQLEYICEVASADQTCNGIDFSPVAVVTVDGAVYDLEYASSDEQQSFFYQEAFQNNTLSGFSYYEIPDGISYEVIRFAVNFREVYFSPR